MTSATCDWHRTQLALATGLAVWAGACAGRTVPDAVSRPEAGPRLVDCRTEEGTYVERARAEGWPLMETFAAPLDPQVWQPQAYSWAENGCVMNDSAIAVRDGTVTLTVRARNGESGGVPSSVDDNKICVGGEIHSVQFFPRAHMTACLRTEASPGTVAAFFAISRYEEPAWHQQEIDFEWLGRDLGPVQFNTHDHTRPRDTDLTGTPSLYPLGFAADGGFHRYELEWDEMATRFWIDGEIAEVRTKDRATLPLDVVFNHYAVTPSLSWAAGWVGPFRPASLPTRSIVDWVAVRELP